MLFFVCVCVGGGGGGLIAVSLGPGSEGGERVKSKGGKKSASKTERAQHALGALCSPLL